LLKVIRLKSKIKSLTFLIICISYLLAGTQKTFAQPCFNFVGDSIGCAPFTVTILSCVPRETSFNFIWNINPSNYINAFTTASYTYSTPGVFIIDQIFDPTTNLKRNVSVFNSMTKPSFSWKTCEDTLIILFQDSVFLAYKFNAGDGVGTNIIVSGNKREFKYRYNFSAPFSTYTFSIQGHEPGTCNKDLINETVSLYKQSQSPILDSLVGLDTNRFNIIMQTRADEPYSIQFQQLPPWQTVKTGKSPNDLSSNKELIIIPQNNQNGKVKTVTINGCGNQFDSPELTMIWPRLQKDNQKILVYWPKTAIANLNKFELWRNGVKILELLGYADTSYLDSNNLVCGFNYCYQIITQRTVSGHSGQLVYKSPPICGQAISDRPPDPVKNLTTNVLDDGIFINGIGSNLSKTYEIFRKEMSAPDFEKILESPTLPIEDKTADFMNRSYCYKISFRDICGNQSLMSEPICPIWLRGDIPNESEKILSWTDLEGWKGGVENYELVRYTPKDSPEILDMGLSNSKTFIGRDSKRQLIWYKIRANAKNTSLYPDPSFSNPVFFPQKSKLRFPDVFTPNDDGLNDKFTCYSLFLTEYELKIFNAWGSLIFFSNDTSKGWNGKIDLRLAQGGPYAYWAKGTDEEGQEITTSGFFTLVR